MLFPRKRRLYFLELYPRFIEMLQKQMRAQNRTVRTVDYPVFSVLKSHPSADGLKLLYKNLHFALRVVKIAACAGG